jgi:hypothetical protein
MGKRSEFGRREADFNPTPRVAVAPLIPYLRGVALPSSAPVMARWSGICCCVCSGDIRTDARRLNCQLRKVIFSGRKRDTIFLQNIN